MNNNLDKQIELVLNEVDEIINLQKPIIEKIIIYHSSDEDEEPNPSYVDSYLFSYSNKLYNSILKYKLEKLIGVEYEKYYDTFKKN